MFNCLKYWKDDIKYIFNKSLNKLTMINPYHIIDLLNYKLNNEYNFKTKIISKLKKNGYN